jgi:hypothetical protein
MFKRKIVLFGKSIPVAAILLAVVAIGAAAWAGLSLLNSIAVATTDAPSVEVAADWTCFGVAGKANSWTHQAFPFVAGKLPGGGLDFTVTDLAEDDLGVFCVASVANADATRGITVTQGGTVPAGLVVTLEDGNLETPCPCTIAAGASRTLGWRILSGGIGPNQSLDFDVNIVPSY